jgi:signal transduction histidine kinase
MRLIATMVGLSLALLAIVSALFFALVGPVGNAFHRVVGEYAHLLAATAPDEARARDLAARLDLQTRYEGPGGAWATSGDLPSIADVERAQATGGASRSDAWDYAVAPRPGGGRYLFVWGHYSRFRAAHGKLLWLTAGLVLGVMVIAHEVIRRSLRPLRTLRSGVERLREGELDVALPTSTRDEFGALTEAFNAMVTRVRDMVIARDRLLLDVSHELRSPLTRMKVALALLPDGDKRRLMEADVAEMETLISELLELERLRDGRALRIELQDLVPILRRAVEAFQDTPPGVLLEGPEGEVPVRVDADKVRTVLSNLLENAAKYALPDSAPVTVSAAREGAWVAVRVRDDGPGIPEADRASLFEPFFRVDRSRSKKTGGYGLGLSICRRIMEAHGGSIGVEGRERRGTTFVLRFPAAS